MPGAVNKALPSATALRVWLDDERLMPDHFDLHVRTAREAIDILARGSVKFISLDHDLAGEHYTRSHHNGELVLPAAGEGTGYDVACWIEGAVAEGRIKMPEWRCHSANPSGRERIEAAMASADRLAAALYAK